MGRPLRGSRIHAAGTGLASRSCRCLGLEQARAGRSSSAAAGSQIQAAARRTTRPSVRPSPQCARRTVGSHGRYGHDFHCAMEYLRRLGRPTQPRYHSAVLALPAAVSAAGILSTVYGAVQQRRPALAGRVSRVSWAVPTLPRCGLSRGKRVGSRSRRIVAQRLPVRDRMA